MCVCSKKCTICFSHSTYIDYNYRHQEAGCAAHYYIYGEVVLKRGGGSASWYRREPANLKVAGSILEPSSIILGHICYILVIYDQCRLY